MIRRLICKLLGHRWGIWASERWLWKPWDLPREQDFRLCERCWRKELKP